MVQIIAGEKGKGKTKQLLDMANAAVKDAKGSVVFIDKSSQNMYELHRKVRLINVNEYPIESSEGFLGFLCGIICQDHDLELVYIDSFLKLAVLEGMDIEATYKALEAISEKYHVTFVISVSLPVAELPEDAQKNVIVSL